MSRLNKKMTSLVIGSEKEKKNFKQAFELQENCIETNNLGVEEFKEMMLTLIKKSK